MDLLFRQNNTREKACLASEKSDLRNMATLEEAHFSGFQTYTTDESAMNFTTSQDVSMTDKATGTKGSKATLGSSPGCMFLHVRVRLMPDPIVFLPSRST